MKKYSEPKISRDLIPNYRKCPESFAEKLTVVRYSANTAKTYISMFEEFINFHNTKEINSITEPQILEFLRHLVRERQVSVSYQNQAINAIKFYYETVLAMPILFELLQNEPEASVRAVLGHFIFVFIHPYMDGNGRMGRFLMNVMLASGGYPWTVIPVEERKTYMDALEKASVDQDIKAFVKFLGYLVDEGLKGTPVATIK